MRFRQSFLDGESSLLSSPCQVSGVYDIMLICSSWDLRCTCITEALEIKATYAIPLFFKVRDSAGLRDRHDKIISNFCEKVATHVHPLIGASVDVEVMWAALYAELREVSRIKGKALRVLIDISACPRYYFSATCAFLLSAGLAESITVFYAEGVYPKDAVNQEIAFTGGRWRTIPIPGLLGRFNPENNRFYLVSLGFEGWKTLRVVSRADPDRVSMLFPIRVSLKNIPPDYGE